MSDFKIWYMKDGECVQMEAGSLMIGDMEIPIIDGVGHWPDTPITRLIQATERDLLERYHRGEFR